MNRYILIDTHSGFVWYDTTADDPLDACAKCDNEFLPGEQFAYRDTHKRDANAEYLVYEAPAGFRECWDGQSQELIDAVESECTYVTAVARRHDA